MDKLTFGQELVREFEINDCYGYPEIAEKIDKAMADVLRENERLRALMTAIINADELDDDNAKGQALWNAEVFLNPYKQSENESPCPKCGSVKPDAGNWVHCCTFHSSSKTSET